MRWQRRRGAGVLRNRTLWCFTPNPRVLGFGEIVALEEEDSLVVVLLSPVGGSRRRGTSKEVASRLSCSAFRVWVSSLGFEFGVWFWVSNSRVGLGVRYSGVPPPDSAFSSFSFSSLTRVGQRDTL
jgi:hypothetical protein